MICWVVDLMLLFQSEVMFPFGIPTSFFFFLVMRSKSLFLVGYFFLALPSPLLHK